MSDDVVLTPRQTRALALDRNLSIIAGAGTGKTAVLSRRYVRILEQAAAVPPDRDEPGACPDQIIAVTYTRKAAQEMRDRIRKEIGKRIQQARDAEDARSLRHWTRMRRHLVDAPITTIHGLATLILREHAIDAEMDPDFGVIQGGDELLLRSEVVQRELENPGAAGRDAVRMLYQLYAPSVVQDTLVAMLGDRGPADRWAQACANVEPEKLLTRLMPHLLPFDDERADGLLTGLQQALRPIAGLPRRGDDSSRDRLLELTARVCESVPVDLLGKARLLEEVFRHFTTSKGKLYAARGHPVVIGVARDWEDSGGLAVPRAVLADVNELLPPLVGQFYGVPGDADRRMLGMMVGLAVAYRGAAAQYEREKERRGVLDFHDLETRAARVLRLPGVGESLRRRWRYLLVDEFQDTNAAQWEMIRALSSEPLQEAVSDAASPRDEDDDHGAFAAAAAYFGAGPETSASRDPVVQSRHDFGSEASTLLASTGVHAAGPDHASTDPHGSTQTRPPGESVARVDAGVPTIAAPASSEDGATSAADLLLEASPDGLPLGRDRAFIVGDAKQSIYGFRGAQLPVYQRSRKELIRANKATGLGKKPLPGGLASGDDPEGTAERLGEIQLDRNFRSLPNLVAFANEVCAVLLAPESPSGAQEDEAEPGPLVAYREAIAGTRGDVELLVCPNHIDKAVDAGLLSHDEARSRTLGDVTAAQLATDIARRVAGEAGPVVGDDGPRTPRYGDIAILLPARTRLDAIRRALRMRGIPHVATGGRGFWGRQEIWDLVNLLAFLADPKRGIEFVGTLRSPLFAWTDDAVVRLLAHDARGHLDRLRDAAHDESIIGPTIDACGVRPADTWTRIRRWRALAAATSASALLEEVLAETGYLAAFAGTSDANRIVANVDQLIEIVRAQERSRPLHLAALVRGLEQLMESTVDQAEADPAGSDNANVVRIMTVHAAKGLEFPIVYVADIGGRRGRGGRGAGVARGDLGGHPLLSHKVLDAAGERTDPVIHRYLTREQARRERLESKRLFYVAITRARDHLILAGTTTRVHEPDGKSKPLKLVVDENSWMPWIETILGLDSDGYQDALAADAPSTLGEASYRVRMLVPRWPNGTSPVREGMPQTLGPAVPQYTMSPLLRASDGATVVHPSLKPLVVAPSRLELHRHCPARFRYAVIEGLPDRALRGVEARTQTRGQLFGTLVHRALSESDEASAEAAVAARSRAAASVLAGDAGKLQAQVLAHAAAARALLANLPVAQATLHEVAIDVAVAPGLRVAGSLDLVRVGPEGPFEVFDYKTDEVDARSPDKLLAHAEGAGYTAQVGAYAAMLGPDTRGQLVYTGAGAMAPVPIDGPVHDILSCLAVDRALRADEEQSPQTLEQALEGLWPRNPAADVRCGACPYFAAQGGPCEGKDGAA